jgi:hypothetical protein
MARLVFIVSRERPELAQTLRREFADNNDVDVIVDRRIADRPPGSAVADGAVVPADRRQERIDERLRSLGWAIIWRHNQTSVYVHEDDAGRRPL